MHVLEMVFAMRNSIMLNANMMAVTAVQLQIWLQMAIAMMRLIIELVHLMVETVVALVSM